MTTGAVLFRCGGQQRRLALSARDVHLLDGEYFLRGGGTARALLGLDFVAGLGPPPTGQVLCTHQRIALAGHLQSLLEALRDQADLLCYSYSYRFASGPAAGRSGGGGTSGFAVDGFSGHIDVRPSGYCYVTLLEVAPTGRARVVQVIDLRGRRELQTDDWGKVTVSRRKAEVGWFDALPPVIAWLKQQRAPSVDVLHE
jgi:hypothetical protein